MYKRQVVLLVLLFSQQLIAAEASRIYLVRHAEKVDQSSESLLTELGSARAERLAELLADEPLTHIFSTPYNRTLLTARPTADSQGIAISEYDGGQLQAFADELLKLEGQILVVGHSNTTPVLVNHLVGTEFPFLEDNIYDRVYVVSISAKGEASLQMQYTEPRTGSEGVPYDPRMLDRPR